MLDWQIFALGLGAVSIVVTAVRAVAREDAEARRKTESQRTARGTPS